MKVKLVLFLTVFMLIASASFAAAHDDNSTDDKLADVLGELSVKVIWDDSSDSSKRPDSVKAGFEGYGDTLGSFVISKGDDWTRHWDNLNIYQTTDQVKLVAEEVPGYTVKVTGSLDERSYTITYTLDKPESDNNTTSPQKNVTNDNNTNSSNNGTVKKDTPKKETPKKEDSKKTAHKKTVKKSKNETKKITDKYNTGYPILLGVLAMSCAGLALGLRRRE